MPFKSGARLPLENTSDEDARVYYQITYDIDEGDSRTGGVHRTSDGSPSSIVLGRLGAVPRSGH